MKKLIRDKIPAILDEKEIAYETIIADEALFVEMLHEKLVEEVQEYIEASTEDDKKEELADVFEVLDTILDIEGYTYHDISSIQAKKKEIRGGFLERIILTKIDK